MSSSQVSPSPLWAGGATRLRSASAKWIAKTTREGRSISRTTPAMKFIAPSGARSAMNIFPPGRASNSATGMPTIFGPHHFCRCSGCVNTSKTRSRGASKTRSMTSSSIGISTTLSLAAMSLLLHLQFLQVLVQTIEPLLPDHAIALDPFVDLFERARLERRRPPLRLLAARHKSRAFEHLEVLAHRGEAHVERLRDLGHRRDTLRETREDRTPRRVGEGTEREAEAVDSHVAPAMYLTTWFITSCRRRCQADEVETSGESEPRLEPRTPLVSSGRHALVMGASRDKGERKTVGITGRTT